MQAKKAEEDAASAQKQVQDDDDDRPLKPTAGVKSERSKTDIRLKHRSSVRIEGLKAKPELNGRFGVILGQFNEESGRWTVLVVADGDKAACQLAVKPENLKPDIHEAVLHGDVALVQDHLAADASCVNSRNG